MTLNDLEPSQKGFLVNFSQYLDAAHISILNCDEMTGVKPRQPAYEIFSIKRRFQQSKSRSPRFMEPGAGGDFGLLHKAISFTRWRHDTSIGGVA